MVSAPSAAIEQVVVAGAGAADQQVVAVAADRASLSPVPPKIRSLQRAAGDLVVDAILAGDEVLLSVGDGVLDMLTPPLSRLPGSERLMR